LNLSLCAVGAIAAHALCIAALLPMLITLPGPGAESGKPAPMVIDVEMAPGPHAALPDARSELGRNTADNPAPSSDPVTAPTPGASDPTGETSALPKPPEAALAPTSPGASPAPSDAAADADPLSDSMTTQSTRPLADQGETSSGGEAKVTGTSSGEMVKEADPAVADPAATEPADAAPEAAPSLARAEPPTSTPPAADPATSEEAAKVPASEGAPKVKKPAKPAKLEPSVKKRAAHANSVAPHLRRVVKAKPKAPAGQGGNFNSLFSGTILAPPATTAKR
jgi:hypothetical protein